MMVVGMNPEKWLIALVPEGVECGGCGKPIINTVIEGVDRFHTCVEGIQRAVEDHLRVCTRVLEYNARDAAFALEVTEG